MRFVAFVLSILLLAGSIDPTRGWLIALVVVTGLAATRLHYGNIWRWNPVLDLRLAAFVLALLLLAGAVGPTRDWLVVLSVVSGLAAFAPKLFHVDAFGGRSHHWQGRMERRWRRHSRSFGDDWS